MAEEEDTQEGLDPQEAALERFLHKAMESSRVITDFDVIALMGLTGSIYALGGPDKVATAFFGYLAMGFGYLASVFGVAIEDMLGFLDWDKVTRKMYIGKQLKPIEEP